MYKDLEFVFVPEIKNNKFSDFFKPAIDLSQVMLFRGNNRIFKEFLSMFLSLDELSDKLNYGSYEFMSRVSVGYLKKDNVRVKPELKNAIRSMQNNEKMGSMMGGKQINFMNEYEYSLEQISHYGKKLKSHNADKAHNTRKNKSRKNKTRKHS